LLSDTFIFQHTGRGTNTMQITDTAREHLAETLKDHPGKYLRVVFQGFG